jgi:hypothetical protein
MANATSTALLAQLAGASLKAALPNDGGPAQNLDVLQITDNNGSAILLNVDFAGVVHNPAVNPTTSASGIGNTRLGQFVTRLSSSATTAQLFADAFSNPSLQDIVQVVNVGGNVSYWLDANGVSHGS